MDGGHHASRTCLLYGWRAGLKNPRRYVMNAENFASSMNRFIYQRRQLRDFGLHATILSIYRSDVCGRHFASGHKTRAVGNWNVGITSYKKFGTDRTNIIINNCAPAPGEDKIW